MSDPRLCIVCRRAELEPTEAQTCIGCLAATRNAVRDIVDLYAVLPDELVDHAGAARPPGASGKPDSDGLPDPLVLYAGGTNGTVNGTKPTAEDPTGRIHAKDHWPSDVPSVVAVLAWWEDDWRTYAGLPADREATVTGCAGYLLARLSWAAQQHPAFDEFARDMTRLRTTLQVATRSDEITERGVPCPECGDQLVRHYRDARECKHPGEHNPACDQGGRPSDWRCYNRECDRREFTEKEYYFAVWANWAEHGEEIVESERDTIRGHDGAGDGAVHHRSRYRLDQRDVVVDEAR